jgi:bacterioferritin
VPARTDRFSTPCRPGHRESLAGNLHLDVYHFEEGLEAMDKAATIDKLNEILKWEYSGLVQYTQFSFLVQDTWREVFSEFFRDNGEEALKHAHKVGDKIVALGGVPTVERAEVKQSTDLTEMLEYSLEVESKQVQLYTEALELCGERDVALRILLEDLCLAEQEGVDHLEKVLKKRELTIADRATTQKKIG